CGRMGIGDDRVGLHAISAAIEGESKGDEHVVCESCWGPLACFAGIRDGFVERRLGSSGCWWSFSGDGHRYVGCFEQHQDTTIGRSEESDAGYECSVDGESFVDFAGLTQDFR